MEDRRGYIGSSDVSAIFGVNPYKSAYDLYEEKTAADFVPQVITPDREKILRRGKKLEPLVLEMLQEEHGIVPTGRNLRYVDKQESYLAAEVDFEIESINGEIKTVSPFAAQDWGAEQTDQIPLWYCLQVMFALMVTERTEAIVAALVGADDLRLYHVKFDHELGAEIRKRVTQFWQGHVLPRVPPAPQTVRDVHKALYRYGGFNVTVDEKLQELLRCLRETKSSAKELDEIQKGYELEIKRELLVRAEAEGLTDTPKKFTLLDSTGKRTASLGYEKRSGYTVGPSEFWILRT